MQSLFWTASSWSFTCFYKKKNFRVRKQFGLMHLVIKPEGLVELCGVFLSGKGSEVC
jgi:hypothetical protein